MGALIIFGWFPVLQTILHLNQRDKEREAQNEIDAQWRDTEIGDAHYASLDA